MIEPSLGEGFLVIATAVIGIVGAVVLVISGFAAFLGWLD